MRRLRLICVLGIAAVAFAALGFGVVGAQTVEKIPDEELPAEVKDAGEYAADWDGSGEHPGKKFYDNVCSTCHSMGTNMLTGPGFAGLFQRIDEGPEHEGKAVQARLLEYIKTVDPAKPDATADPYFQKVQAEVGGPGVQMSLRGGLGPDVTDRQILDLIDYILRFRGIDFSEEEYLQQVKLGRSLVSGESSFKWGGPSCTGCHSVGSDPDLMGANIGPNIAHTYVLARQLGKDDKSNYADGVYELLSGENAPAAHYYYKDEEGSHPLTEGELLAVTTFFEQAARDTGTEKQSNYLPILALLVAAFCILLMEPGVVNVLFAKEHHEYIDGPYEEEHHDEDHEKEPKSDPAPAAEAATGADDKASEEKAESEEPKAEAEPEPKVDAAADIDEEPKPATEVADSDDDSSSETGNEDKPDGSDEDKKEEGKQD